MDGQLISPLQQCWCSCASQNAVSSTWHRSWATKTAACTAASQASQSAASRRVSMMPAGPARHGSGDVRAGARDPAKRDWGRLRPLAHGQQLRRQVRDGQSSCGTSFPDAMHTTSSEPVQRVLSSSVSPKTQSEHESAQMLAHSPYRPVVLSAHAACVGYPFRFTSSGSSSGAVAPQWVYLAQVQLEGHS